MQLSSPKRSSTQPDSSIGMALNFDVLLVIGSYLDTRTLSFLLRTCQSLACHRNLLVKDRKIYLRTLSSVTSFCDFVHADPQRSALIREVVLILRISMSVRRSGVLAFFEYLNQILQEAENLLHLDIRAPHFASTDFGAYIDLFPRLARITTLRTLSLRCASLPVERTALSLLVKCQSQVENLTLVFYPPPLPPADHIAILPAEVFLSQIVNSLATLDLTLTKIESTNLVFHRLHTLTLRSNRTKDIEPYLVACPNLRHLRLLSVDDPFSYSDNVNSRTRNLSIQQDEIKKVGWRHLQDCTGDLRSIFLLAIRNVSRLHITQPISLKFDDEIDMLHVVLQCARPKCLAIALEPYVDTEEDLLAVSTLVPASFPLEAICVTIDFTITGLTVERLEGKMDTLIALLCTLRVTHLLVHITGFLSYYRDRRFRSNICWNLPALDGIDSEALARRFAEASATLSHVFVAISETETFWEVVRGMEGAAVRRLEEGQGEEIKQEMNMRETDYLEP
ncbi:hypothetical protein OF83DRAFT_1127738 [Amylostereum chailletii]|nr:hypothetical protein OF83DRAFT_1127738 [Amylostereum chailletii]